MHCFAQGCGGKLMLRAMPDRTASDHAVVAKGMAAQLVPAFQREKLPFWYIDSAYIQIPGRRHCRIERGRFYPPADMGEYNMARAYNMGIRLQPWRQNGRHVLLCLPGPGAGKDWGINSVKWGDSIRRKLRLRTERPIKVRPKIIRECKPLADDLEDAWCVVTHSSTAAVEAVIAGVPVFVEPTNAAMPVGRTISTLRTRLGPNEKHG